MRDIANPNGKKFTIIYEYIIDKNNAEPVIFLPECMKTHVTNICWIIENSINTNSANARNAMFELGFAQVMHIMGNNTIFSIRIPIPNI